MEPSKIKGIIVVGASLGGFSAIKKFLTSFSQEFPIPIAICLHREGDVESISSDSSTLSALIERYSLLPVSEPENKEIIKGKHVYIASPDYHLLIDGDHFAVSLEEPISYARPSIDVLFESAADSHENRVIGILLTGNNIDGAKGISRIKEMGGFTIVEDPKTAEAKIMPDAAIKETKVHKILPLAKIGQYVVDNYKRIL